MLVIEVVNSNPNGDPDRENDPRQRDIGGEISPVSFKRKLRDLLEDHTSPFFKALPEKFVTNENRYNILEQRGRDRKTIINEMGKDPSEFMESEFVNKYWDARVFGNTFLDKGNDKGFIKSGVVQFGVGVSLAPINIIRETNTNKAGVEEDKNAGMAPLAFRVVEHGVYTMNFFVNPNFAHKTGCTADDIELLRYSPRCAHTSRLVHRTQKYARQLPRTPADRRAHSEKTRQCTRTLNFLARLRGRDRSAGKSA